MSVSTGPRTAAGKAISSQNSLKHGLASGRLIIEGEDPANYQANLDEYINDLKPVGKTELALVTEIANAQWFKDRAYRFQAIAFDNHVPTAEHTVPPELGVLIRYQTANERAFYRALKTLQALQKERKVTPKQFVSQIHVLAPQEDEMEARIQAGEDRLSVIEAGIQSERKLRSGYLNATGRS
jgi:hypothetical protein